mmetsp:Transcript_73316/g.107648  ORF Transcript_73316/g.107648 Transcript_73316/m.107648 type:complete len:202 (-) Transcript_73316:82-687(-)
MDAWRRMVQTRLGGLRKPCVRWDFTCSYSTCPHGATGPNVLGRSSWPSPMCIGPVAVIIHGTSRGRIAGRHLHLFPARGSERLDPLQNIMSMTKTRNAQLLQLLVCHFRQNLSVHVVIDHQTLVSIALFVAKFGAACRLDESRHIVHVPIGQIPSLLLRRMPGDLTVELERRQVPLHRVQGLETKKTRLLCQHQQRPLVGP